MRYKSLWRRRIIITNIFVTIFSILALCQAVTCYTAQPLNEGIDELTSQIAQKLADGHKQRVAVIEFSDLQGRVTEFGGYVSEELITRLFRTDKIQVVERQLLNKVIEEHKLRVTGAIDEKTAKRFGRLLGADTTSDWRRHNREQTVKRYHA